jgi:hypothetical protein
VGEVSVERWYHPNSDALLDPIEVRPNNNSLHWSVIRRRDLVRLLEAAGYVPDNRDAAEFDEAAWADDMGVAT